MSYNSGLITNSPSVSENEVTRRRLESKCDALRILTNDFDQCRQERDQFKLMAEQVQERYQDLKRQLAGVGPKHGFEEMKYSGMKSQSLAHLLCEMRDVNKSMQLEIDDLKQKLTDAEGDIKLLREQIARQRTGTTDEGLNIRYFPAHEREELVEKLESSNEKFGQVQRDLQQVLDEKEDLETERDVYKDKYNRLNQELNYILKGDENRILDIDALVMENKYLQKSLRHMEEEKSLAMATVSKYKNILERKKNKGILKLGQSRIGGVVISQKQVQSLLSSNSGSSSPTPQMLADLQSLASGLLETVNDKNMALSHQRKTNKILGGRVSELEKKLKTLEVSGLWNVPNTNSSLEKLRMECEEIKTLIPLQVSTSSEPLDSPEDPKHTDGEEVPLGGTFPDSSQLCRNNSISLASQSSDCSPFSSPLHSRSSETNVSPAISLTDITSLDNLDLSSHAAAGDADCFSSSTLTHRNVDGDVVSTPGSNKTKSQHTSDELSITATSDSPNSSCDKSPTDYSITPLCSFSHPKNNASSDITAPINSALPAQEQSDVFVEKGSPPDPGDDATEPFLKSADVQPVPNHIEQLVSPSVIHSTNTDII